MSLQGPRSWLSLVEHDVLMALGGEKLAVFVSNTGAEEGWKAPHPQKMARSGPEMDLEEQRHLVEPCEMRTGLYGPLWCAL